MSGHFGPELRRFVLLQHHHDQVTLERLTRQLCDLGISISKRQLIRLLIEGQDRFLAENREVLRAGLQTARWITVDDTAARHARQNGFCTQIGNDRFTWFGTRASKSRLNFLDLLRAGHADYVINDAALEYMRGRALAGPLIGQFAAQRQTEFADRNAWQAHLDRLGLSAFRITPDPVQIATEGALWGSIHAHGLLHDAVIISDDAGQFAVGRHALCWVHTERLVHKLDTFTALHRNAVQCIRALIWQFDADLKAYSAAPSLRSRSELRDRFDHIFDRRTGFAAVDRLLQRLHANKAELLTVLERPGIPLHTNGSERDIRCHVTKRKISGGTQSETFSFGISFRVRPALQKVRSVQSSLARIEIHQGLGGMRRHVASSEVSKVVRLEPGTGTSGPRAFCPRPRSTRFSMPRRPVGTACATICSCS